MPAYRTQVFDFRTPAFLSLSHKPLNFPLSSSSGSCSYQIYIQFHNPHYWRYLHMGKERSRARACPISDTGSRTSDCLIHIGRRPSMVILASSGEATSDLNLCPVRKCYAQHGPEMLLATRSRNSSRNIPGGTCRTSTPRV